MSDTKQNKLFAFPRACEAYSEDDLGMTLRDYASIEYMSAIISNAQTMSEITKSWKQVPEKSRLPFEECIAKLSLSYADAFLKQREL